MRRPGSSALPSYAPPDDRRAADAQPLVPMGPARSNRRWWLLFYVVLAVYALSVLGSFVLGWGPRLSPKQQAEQPQLVVNTRGVATPSAKEVNEPEEGFPGDDPNEENEEDMLNEQAKVEELRALGGLDGAGDTEGMEVASSALEHQETSAAATADILPDQIPPATDNEVKTTTTTPQESTDAPITRADPVVLLTNAKGDEDASSAAPDDMKVLSEPEDAGEVLKDLVPAVPVDAPKEAWTVENSVQDTSETEAPKEPAVPVVEITQPPVRRSENFMKALDLVHLPETKPPNPYFHVFPVRTVVTEDARLMNGMRNKAGDRDDWTVEGHMQEVDRLQSLKEEAKRESERLKLLITAAEKLIVEEKDMLEDKRALKTLDIRRHQPRKVRNNLKCTGWRQTGECSPYGKREPSKDLACNQVAQGGVSGYCEVMDEDTGELFRVMQLNCSSVRDHVVFSCSESADFANFGIKAQNVYHDAVQTNTTHPSSLLGNIGSGNGIVMVVYPKLLTSVFASIKVLRSYNCTLPIELWISQPEVVRTPSMKQTLEMLQRRFSNVTVETIMDPTIAGFSTKIHAVVHSKFENVLFLDADNVPVRDPTFLFESREFREKGAIFWPDFWHPEKTIFNIQHESLLWELVDLPFVDMFEQESGQILINRKRAALALEVLMFFAYHRPSHFERLVLAHGDKDLFRLAWMKTNTSYYMMPFPPASAGTVRGTYKKQFCGMTMVQFDVDGEVLFLHRNAKKLDGKVDKIDPKYWTHLQTFKWENESGATVGDSEHDVTFPGARHAVERMISYEDIKKKYQIGIQASGPLFKEFESCYGAEPNVVDNFNMTLFEDLPFANLEQQLVDFAHEAALLMARTENLAQGRLGVQ